MTYLTPYVVALGLSFAGLAFGQTAAPPTTVPHPAGSATSSEVKVTLALGGDVQFGRYGNGKLMRHSSDRPLAAVIGLLQSADLSLVNLENPASDRDPEELVTAAKPKKFTYRLRAPTSVLAGLKEAGVDVVSIANNHSADLDLAGTHETVAALDLAGLAHVGIAADDPFAPIAVPAGATTAYVFGLTTFMNRKLAAPSPVAQMSLDDIATTLAARVAVVRAAHPAELIVVSLHWGIESSTSPRDKHAEVAHALIDNGANVIMGHHSHTLQPVEVYKGAVIFYSLGNLSFDMPEVEARRSAIAHVSLTRGPAPNAAWSVATVTLNAVQRTPKSDGPRPATLTEARPLLQRVLRESSDRFGTTFLVEAGRAVWRR